MGKGSHRRPTEVTDKEFKDNWENIFKNTKEVVEKQVAEARSIKPKRTFIRKPKKT